MAGGQPYITPINPVFSIIMPPVSSSRYEVASATHARYGGAYFTCSSDLIASSSPSSTSGMPLLRHTAKKTRTRSLAFVIFSRLPPHPLRSFTYHAYTSRAAWFGTPSFCAMFDTADRSSFLLTNLSAGNVRRLGLPPISIFM